MHTMMVIAGGFALLAAILAIGWLISGRAGMSKGGWLFLPLWLAASLINLWVGVSRAGYPLSVEAPIFAVVFLVPAAVAWFVVRRLTGSASS